MKQDELLDDFIRYAKEQFGYEISVEKCDKPDTFASIIGVSFLNDKICKERSEVSDDKWRNYNELITRDNTKC